jgi:hypothetical protein
MLRYEAVMCPHIRRGEACPLGDLCSKVGCMLHACGAQQGASSAMHACMVGRPEPAGWDGGAGSEAAAARSRPVRVCCWRGRASGSAAARRTDWAVSLVTLLFPAASSPCALPAPLSPLPHVLLDTVPQRVRGEPLHRSQRPACIWLSTAPAPPASCVTAGLHVRLALFSLPPHTPARPSYNLRCC